MKIAKAGKVDHWYKIPVDDDTFEVHLRRPTFADIVKDCEGGRGRAEHRVKAGLLDWRGVTEEYVDPADGQKKERPVPFSWENFQRLTVSNPFVFRMVEVTVTSLYNGVGEDDEKNLQAWLDGFLKSEPQDSPTENASLSQPGQPSAEPASSASPPA